MRTDNLELVPYTPQDIRALIEGVEAYEKSVGIRPAEGLRDYILSDDVSPAYLAELRTATATKADPWMHGFAVVHTASRTVIGAGGFKGPPDAGGMVEIAYGIVPAYQGKGFATEVAQALIKYASASGRVRILRAHTLAAENASTTVLTKCGFTRVGEVEDPEDGLVWRWERSQESVSDIYNFREVDGTLSTSGQPTETQLSSAARGGVQVVINLAPHNSPSALNDEPGCVAALGMDYVHIPVQFSAPTEADLLAFFDAMHASRDRKVLVHCAANKRVTAFLGLYRALKQGWSPDRAFALMHSVWEPDAIWAQFIAAMLDRPRAGHL
jgi:uncharacterized protein (TIGR01244 family)